MGMHECYLEKKIIKRDQSKEKIHTRDTSSTVVEKNPQPGEDFLCLDESARMLFGKK